MRAECAEKRRGIDFDDWVSNGFARSPFARVREAPAAGTSSKCDATCKENQSKVSLTIAWFTPLSEIRSAKFVKNSRSSIWTGTEGVADPEKSRLGV